MSNHTLYVTTRFGVGSCESLPSSANYWFEQHYYTMALYSTMVEIASEKFCGFGKDGILRNFLTMQNFSNTQSVSRLVIARFCSISVKTCR